MIKISVVPAVIGSLALFAFIQALFDLNPINLNVSMISGPNSGQSFSRLLVTQLRDCAINEATTCASAKTIVDEIDGLFTNAQKYKGLTLNEIPPTLARQDYPIRFMDFSDPSILVLTCDDAPEIVAPVVPPQTSETKEATTKPKKGKWVIGKTTADFAKTLKKRDAAKVSAALDRGEKLKVTDDLGIETLRKNDVVSANIAMAYESENLKLFTSEYTVRNLSIDTSLYVKTYIALDYESNINAEKETDDLSFGLNFSKNLPIKPLKSASDYPVIGLVQFAPDLSRFELDLAYITDIEERDSKQWFTEARLPLFDLVPAQYFAVGDKSFQPTFDFTAVIDYSQIDERGDKVELEDEEYFRLGYNAALNLPLFELTGMSFDYMAKYSWRESLDNSASNADYWDMGFKFTPSPILFWFNNVV